MLRTVTTLLTVLVLPLTAAYGHEGDSAAQDDWSGGDGVPGPVADWGNTFDAATNINWSETPGELLLNRALTENVIADAIENAESICAGDIDDDGDVDIAAATGTALTWWENADGSGSSWVEHIVYTGSYTAHCVNTGDLDGDGDLDLMWTYGVFFSSGYWFENADGSGTSWNMRSSFGAYYLRAADIDGDDDVDIVGATLGNTLVYWENTDGTGLAWAQHTIDDAFDVSISVYVADIDADNDLDVVAAALSGDEVAWWQNDGSSPPVWTKVSVDGAFTGARTVFVDDIDGDEDADIVAGGLGHETAWWANVDGSGTTWVKEIISDDAEVNSVYAADMDDDGDGDVLSARNSDNNIVLYENIDGLGTTWDTRILTDDAPGGLYVEVADIDGDDQPEVMSSLRGGTGSGALRWWEVSGYQESGELVSSVLDTGGPADWGQIDWTDNAPEGTTVKFQVRASNSWGIMGNWSGDITTHPFSFDGFLEDGLRYFQYKTILEAADTSMTPVLEDVTIDWGYTDITITSFSADSVREGVNVTWECADEVAGFNLYRSEGSGEGKAVKSRDKINAGLITGESPYTYLDATVGEDTTYSYWLEAVDVGGATETFGPVECTWNGALPTAYALYQSRPNPAPGTAIIAFDLPEDTKVTLAVYDISGRKVTTLLNETLTVGEHEAEVAGLAPGVYVYRLNAGSFNAARKMVVVK